jgi:hypothetical protein
MGFLAIFNCYLLQHDQRTECKWFMVFLKAQWFFHILSITLLAVSFHAFCAYKTHSDILGVWAGGGLGQALFLGDGNHIISIKS